MNSASWSSYRAAMPAECLGEYDPDDTSRCHTHRCDSCGRFISTNPSSGSRLDITPGSMFGSERIDWLCAACAARTPMPPSVEQVRQAERREMEDREAADELYMREMAEQADREAAARVGRCDYCGGALADSRAPGGTCKACEESAYAEVELFDGDEIPW